MEDNASNAAIVTATTTTKENVRRVGKQCDLQGRESEAKEKLLLALNKYAAVPQREIHIY